MRISTDFINTNAPSRVYAKSREKILKNIFALIVSFGIILSTLMFATVGDTNPDSVGTIPLTDDIGRSKAAFAVVDEEIARRLNLHVLSEWDYQKLRGPVLWKIRAPIHFHLREQFGRIVHTVDFGVSAGSGSPSQNPSINRGKGPPRLHERAAEIIRDFIDQEHISVIIRSDAPIGIGEIAAIRRLRGEVRYTYESINGACVVIPIKSLTGLIRQQLVMEIWPDAKMNLALNTSVPRIGADVVHNAPHPDLGVTGEGVVVAVVDGGIDGRHSALTELKDRFRRRSRVVDTRGVLGGGGSNKRKDEVDHGTHVAGIIGAKGNMVTGVAPEVLLLDAQVDLNNDTYFFREFGDSSDVMDAIRWAANKHRVLNARPKADIINMSLGAMPWQYTPDGRTGKDPLSKLVDEVVSDGIIFVVSAGNERENRSTGSILSDPNPIRYSTATHEFRVSHNVYSGGVIPDVKITVTLLWDTKTNDLDLTLQDFNNRIISSSEVNGDYYEEIEFTSKVTDPQPYKLRVGAAFNQVQTRQKYEVWGSKRVRFLSPNPMETVTVPGYSEKVITVGAIDSSDLITSFSSQGPSRADLIKPEIVAPGGKIKSTISAGGYDSYPGTSMAAPHVAGVAALILDAVGKNDRDEWNFNPDEVKSAIVRGAEELTNMPDNTYGAGLVKADNIIFGNTVPANGKLRFEIKPRLYRSNYGGYRLNADPYLVAAISWRNPAHDLDLVLSDAANGRRLPMVSEISSTAAKIGGNEFIFPASGTTYFLDVINKSQEPVTFTGAATHKIEFFSIPDQTPPSVIPTRNQPPGTVSTIPSQNLTLGSSSPPLDVSAYFRDPDSNTLTYTVESSNPAVATTQRVGSQLTVWTWDTGRTTVTVKATDPDGLYATQTFTVTVTGGPAQNQPPEAVNTIPLQTLLLDASPETVDVVQYFSSQNELIYEVESNPRGIVTESVSGSRVTIRPRQLGSTSVIVTARDRDNSNLYAIQTISVLVYTNRATIVRPPSDPTFRLPAPASSVGLKIGDSVITQLTPGFTLAVRPIAGTNNIPRERIGSGITGTIKRGPRSNEGFTWWYIEWDIRGQNLEGWSVEADRGQILFRRPPDLEIQDLDVSEDAVEPGETFKIEVRIRNKGPGESAPTEVYLYYSPNRHSDVEELDADSDNLRVAGKGTLKVPSLRAGSSSEVSLSVEAPMTPDRYYYGALLPSNIHETDYKGDLNPDVLHNNLAREERVEVASSPDLIVESVSANRSTLDPGESFRLDVTVRNQGIGEPERKATLRYYRSRDANISKSDREVGDDTISSSNLDTNGTAKRSESIKASIEPGVYYYGVCIDSVKGESNTNNNCSSAVAITVRAPEPSQTPDPVETPDPPDLIVESVRVSDNTLAPGETFTLYATVRNQKTGASPSTQLRYYRSADPTVSRSDTEVGTDAVGPLNAGSTETENIGLTAPLAAGTYYYGACVDSDTGEKDTNNNCSRSVTITVQQPAQTQTAGAIYWTDWDTNKIQRAHLNGSNVQDLITTGLGSPYGIALDVAGGKMYWADAGTAKIQRANLDGSNIQNLVPLGLGLPICIALDVPGGKMYWTDRGTGKIQRANLDGSNVEDLVFGVKGLHGIALDVAGNKMYWTDNEASKIQRSNLDGTMIEDLVTTGLQLPNEIALDIAGSKMYWVDDGTRRIQRANLNGANVQDLVTTGLHTPVGITLDSIGGKMYWTDLGTRRIQRANLNGTSVQNLVTTGLNAPFGITLGTSLTFSPPVMAREDVNNDGIVDAQDVALVDQNNLDLNDDGVSDIADILLVVEAMGKAGGAPAARSQAQHLLTAEKIQQWLIEAALLDEDSSTYQQGILVLEQLLALLAPRETVLLPNYPNPFNPETWIPYQIAEPADVTVHIYATTGRLVRTLRLGHQQAGVYHNRNRAAYWDGRNALGEFVASGVYFYTLSAGNFTATRKMLMRK